MDAHTEIDLDTLHQTILDGISAQFPDLATVDDYREERGKVALPACLVEILDFEPVPDEDPGTEQLAVRAQFQARLIIGFRTADAQREIRKMATALAAYLRLQRWGLPVGPAQVTSIEPDEFEPELDRYEVWRVEWGQTIHLGSTVWTNDGTIPTEVYATFEPEEDDTAEEYTRVNQ